MKTTFSRTFFTAMFVLLLSLLAVGVFLRALLADYLNDSAFDRLKNDAQVISELAVAYRAGGSLDSMDFLINLDVASQVSDADSVICDETGRILVCSDSPLGCEHQSLSVGGDFMVEVLKTGQVTDTGIVQGLYEDTRYVCAVPIRSDGEDLGIVIVSRPVASTEAVLYKMTDIYVFLSVMVVLVSVLAIGFFVNRQMRPLKMMAKAATAFGHGDLDARVEVKEHYPYEVEELARAFNNMATSLQKSEYQRREFVANVSHELKTPMTTIGGYVDGILDGTIPEERAGHYMRLVSEETKRLSRLVRSMLDISRLQAEGGIPEEKKTRFDLEELVGRVLITFERKINAKGLEVEVQMPEYPVYTFAEEDQMTQVVYNLVDNAVKFCPEGGRLGVSVREGGGKAYVSVSNDGETIPPEELPLVFDRFHKTDKSRSRKDGWGLGLYIVRTIVCGHGEDISVTSRDGRTEFTFTLPVVI